MQFQRLPSASIDLPPTRSKTNFMVRPAGVEPATIRAGKELNPQPSALEAPALPIELPTYNLAETVRFELTCRVNDAFFSREAFSATQARLHMRNDVIVLFGAAHLNRTGSYAFSARRTHQLYQSGNNVAETVRFELTSRWVAPAACFPSRSLRPLGHVSMNVLCSTGWARTSVPFQAL